MAVRAIVKYPDAALARATESVERFDAELEMLASNLLDTIRAAPGIGITGPHIGVLQRVTVIEIDRKAGPTTYVNPEVLWSSDETVSHAEGSVSMPGISEDVTRPARVRVSYQTLAGERIEIEAHGLLAVCLQHEIDQLDGIFWLQRLSRLKRDRAIKRFSALQRRQAL